MEENLGNEEEKFKKIEEQEEKPKGKFIIKYIIFVLILAILTVVAIYFTIQYRNRINNNEETKNDVSVPEKKIAEDSKYAVSSYTDTYNENAIKVIEYYDDNGKLYTESRQSQVQFIQISGLKNSDIEAKINYRLKEEAYSLKNNNGGVNTQVMGNFANILSVLISSYYSENDEYFYKNKSINIDLNTGEDIPFEKVFVSSAPIKALLVDGLNEELAWSDRRKNSNEEMLYEDYNIDNVDTSEYEERALILAKKYERKKDNIEYCITPRQVLIYNLLDKDILVGDDAANNVWLTIDLAKNKDEIAIYKRYINSENIYEDSSLKAKNIIVFTDSYMKDFKTINYGKIKNNIFLEEAAYCYEEEIYDYVKEFIEKKSKELQESIKNEITENEGMICQRFYDVSYYGQDKNYIYISARTCKAICSKEYFQENAFKDYIQMKSSPRADIGINNFTEYNQDKFPNLNIIEGEYEYYYLDKSGNIVATSWEEMRNFVNN